MMAYEQASFSPTNTTTINVLMAIKTKYQPLNGVTIFTNIRLLITKTPSANLVTYSLSVYGGMMRAFVC